MFGRTFTFLVALVCLVASGFTTRKGDLFSPPAEPTLLHYWNFDEANFLVPNIGSGSISYNLSVPSGQIVTGDGQSFDGTLGNTHLRANFPIETVLRFNFSTEGYNNVVVTYETRRSGSGAGTQKISYTLNGTDYTDFTTVLPPDGTPTIATLDFSSVEGVEDNANFGIRFQFEEAPGGAAGNNRFDDFTVEGVEIPQVELLHYWNFNETAFLDPNVGTGSISYEIFPGADILTATGNAFDALNARNGDIAGAHLRANNPLGRVLSFNFTTEGYKDIVVKYETRRSGTAAATQKVSYTLNGTDYVDFTDVITFDDTPAVITLDFSAIAQANDNSNFGIRFQFEDGTGGGNNRFDDFTVEGISKDAVIPVLTNPVVLTAPTNDATDVALKPTLTWESLTNASTYDVQISTAEDFNSTVIDASGLSATAYPSAVQLQVNTTYHWRARGVNSSGAGPWSGARSFITIETFAGSALRLNEVMASNKTFTEDEDGDNSDWMELYNDGNDALNLSGFGLSDNPSQPFKWTFPAETIQPHAFLVVWASDKNRTTPGSPLHTNYAISAGGETITITNGEGTTIDQFAAPAMDDDVSWGRFPDGSGPWIKSDEATPEAPNATGTVPLDATVTFSHTSGFYATDFNLQLTTNESDASIIYTIDGSTPEINNLSGTTYQYKTKYPYNPGDPVGALFEKTFETLTLSGDIHVTDRSAEPNKISGITTTRDKTAVFAPGPVDKATVVKARVSKPGFSLGPVITNTYFIGPRTDHDLPIFSFSANEDLLFDYNNGMYVPGVDFDNWRQSHPNDPPDGWNPGNYHRDIEINASVQFFEQSATTAIVNQDMTSKLSGNFSVHYPSKSLRLEASGTGGASAFNYKFFADRDAVAYKNLVLRNGGNDFPLTLFRDAAIQKSISHLNVSVQAYRPAVLYINGEYWGLTTLRERLDEDYIENHFGVDGNLDLIEVLSPDEGTLDKYDQYLHYIGEHDMTDSVVFATSERMMDTDNLIDYQISEIFSANTDWPGNNYMVWRSRNEFDPNADKYHDGRFRWLIKDTDFGWGLKEVPSHNTLAFATAVGGPVWPNPEWSTHILRYNLENPGFKERFITRFADLLNTTFVPSRLTGIIADMKAELAGEMPEHIARWNQPQDWDGNINVMINFVTQRQAYQRTHIKSKFALTERNLTVNVDDPDKGFIHVNTIDILPTTPGVAPSPYPWTGKYFQGVPVTISAIPKPGWIFVRWEGADLPASHEVSVNLTANMNITAIFGETIHLVAPVNNSEDIGLQPEFQWTEPAPGFTYVVQVAKDANFTKVFFEKGGLDPTSYISQEKLMPSTVYYWRVGVEVPGHKANWGSEVSSFKTLFHLPDMPVAVLPSAEERNLPVRPTLSWEAAAYTETYSIAISTSTGFEAAVPVTGIEDTELTLTNALSFSTKYYWRIKSTNNSGDSEWSEAKSFTTSGPPTTVTVATQPGETTATVSWTSVTESEEYELHLSTMENFQNTVALDRVAGLQMVLSDLPDATYYVRVRAIYEIHPGEWSDSRSFEIANVLAVNDNAADAIIAYPNPVKDKLQLNIPRGFVIRSLNLIDAVGRMSELPVSNEIDLSDKQAGMFFLRITDVYGKSATLKIMKIR